MIEAVHIEKHFEKICAISDMSARIQEGAVFGLVGSNGAGKSTFLRLICGVLKPDQGQILVDEEPVWEQESAKRTLFFYFG